MAIRRHYHDPDEFRKVTKFANVKSVGVGADTTGCFTESSNQSRLSYWLLNMLITMVKMVFDSINSVAIN